MGKLNLELRSGAAVLLFFWLSFFAEPIKARYGKVILIILFISTVLSFLTSRAKIRGIFTDKSDIALWLYILALSLCVLFAQNRKIAFAGYIEYAVPIPILYYLFKNEFCRIKEKKWLFVFICIFSALVSIIAILESIFRKNIIYEYPFLKVHREYYESFFIASHRAISTQIASPVLGTYLISCIPVAYYIIHNARQNFLKILGFISAVLIFIGIILTFARAAFISFIILSTIYFYKKNRKILLFILFPILIILVTHFSINGRYAGRRFGIKNFIYNRDYAFRADRFIITLKILKRSPLTGVGLGNYRYVFDKYSATKEVPWHLKIPDNMFSSILSESGILGFLAFACFIIQLLKKGFRFLYQRGRQDNREVALALIVAICGILINMNSYDLLYWTAPFYIFWIYCGFLSSLIHTD